MLNLPPVQAEIDFDLAGEVAMEDFGCLLAGYVSTGLMMTLRGDLGAGKTTLARGILHGLGHPGSVKSPTYTVVEPYDLSVGRVYHFDLYRLDDPEELEFLGFRDYLTEAFLCIVEWPERGYGHLSVVDLAIDIKIRRWGRSVVLSAHSIAGGVIIQRLDALGGSDG